MEASTSITPKPFDCTLCAHHFDRGPSSDIEKATDVSDELKKVEAADAMGEPTPTPDTPSDQIGYSREFIHVLRTAPMPCCFTMVHPRCIKMALLATNRCPNAECQSRAPLESPEAKAKFVTYLYLKRATFNPESGDLLNTSSELISRIFQIKVVYEPFLALSEVEQRKRLATLMYGGDELGDELFTLITNPWRLAPGRDRDHELLALYKIASYAKPLEKESSAHLRQRYETFFNLHVAANPILQRKLILFFNDLYVHINGPGFAIEHLQRTLHEFEASFPSTQTHFYDVKILGKPLTCNRACKCFSSLLAAGLCASYILFMVVTARNFHLIKS